ncbi:uncharacterized protein A4U43_C07F6150 [Asparagus officinalis]|uniref:peroxidase n=1 Tax=Asparagus officinalis TaxID=4686 RepID=A0A5P1E9U9_ASPOF|nr:uncharacterized protein A4U43_C07F6150 [Asparagus officinalis]
MKEAVEAICPGVVSCSDILAISARDAVTMLGGPSWIVKLGRKDSRTPHFSLTADRPSPHANLTLLMAKFSGKGFSVTDLVALSGAHSIGLAKCSSFRDHVYDDSNVDPAFAKDRQSSCPIAPGPGDDNLAPLDLQSPTKFGVDYYVNLIAKKGLLHSDQELYNGGLTDILVETYSRNRTRFYVRRLRRGDGEDGRP